MNVCHVIPYIGAAQGGPVASLRDLTGAMPDSVRTSIATTPLRRDGPPVAFPQGVNVQRFDGAFVGNFRYSPALSGFLHTADVDILHSHGLWTYASYAAGRAAARRSIPHILAPCGMLQKGALQRSSLKKWLCRALFQDRIVRDATCLVAKSDTELDGFRAIGLVTPVAVIPNPIDAPEVTAEAMSAFREKHGLGEAPFVLFLGRLHPVKGLSRLLEAWQQVHSNYPACKLVIAGPNEDGHLEALTAQWAKTSAWNAIRFTGALTGDDKWAALKAAYVLAMPSDFENFGSAIAEALAVGTPAVTTTGTPWSQLPKQGAGWWVEPSADALGQALSSALRLDERDLTTMSSRARAVTAAFTGKSVARSVLGLYTWILHGGDAPACVRTA